MRAYPQPSGARDALWWSGHWPSGGKTTHPVGATHFMLFEERCTFSLNHLKGCRRNVPRMTFWWNWKG